MEARESLASCKGHEWFCQTTCKPLEPHQRGVRGGLLLEGFLEVANLELLIRNEEVCGYQQRNSLYLFQPSLGVLKEGKNVFLPQGP